MLKTSLAAIGRALILTLVLSLAGHAALAQGGKFISDLPPLASPDGANTDIPAAKGGVTGKITPDGIAGAAGLAVTKHVTKTTGTYTAVAADRAQAWRASGAVTVNLTAAATLGDGWSLWVRANGGAVTIDPAGAELINGAATLTLPDGQEVLIVCTGAAFQTISAGAGPGGTVVTLGDTQTLANKTLTSPVITNGGTLTLPSGAETLVGRATTDTLTNKTLTTPTVTLKQGTNPTPTGEGDIQWDTDDDWIVVGTGSSRAFVRPPTVTVFSSSGTWNKPAGLRKVFVQVVGPGGGGAGATGGSSQASLGGGGGGGGYAQGWVDAATLAASVTVTVGTGGAGGATNATPQNGSAGSGSSSFGAHLSASTGAGGGAMSTGTTAISANGGAYGAGSAGDVLTQGNAGGNAVRFSGTAGFSGFGGSSILGGGGRGTAGSDLNGDSGLIGGGGGGATSFTTAQRAGGNGGNGIVIVTEYY